MHGIIAVFKCQFCKNRNMLTLFEGHNSNINCSKYGIFAETQVTMVILLEGGLWSLRFDWTAARSLTLRWNDILRSLKRKQPKGTRFDRCSSTAITANRYERTWDVISKTELEWINPYLLFTNIFHWNFSAVKLNRRLIGTLLARRIRASCHRATCHTNPSPVSNCKTQCFLNESQRHVTLTEPYLALGLSVLHRSLSVSQDVSGFLLLCLWVSVTFIQTGLFSQTLQRLDKLNSPLSIINPWASLG